MVGGGSLSMYPLGLHSPPRVGYKPLRCQTSVFTQIRIRWLPCLPSLFPLPTHGSSPPELRTRFPPPVRPIPSAVVVLRRDFWKTLLSEEEEPQPARYTLRLESEWLYYDWTAPSGPCGLRRACWQFMPSDDPGHTTTTPATGSFFSSHPGSMLLHVSVRLATRFAAGHRPTDSRQSCLRPRRGSTHTTTAPIVRLSRH